MASTRPRLPPKDTGGGGAKAGSELDHVVAGADGQSVKHLSCKLNAAGTKYALADTRERSAALLDYAARVAYESAR